MALPAALSGSWNPFRVTGTPMPPNLLLMCKLLVVAILGTGHIRLLPEPFLPFIDGLDQLTDPDVFRIALQAVAVMSALALLLNRCVRASALVLGSCFLVAVVSSKAYYGNNKSFCGLALLLAGLSDFDRPPYLLRWQLSLVYFGAALNKLLDPDWQSGLFFHYWAGAKLQNPIYLFVAELLPPLLAGKIMCWGTILAEFAASLGLLAPRLAPYALWANILFQVGLLEFTGTTFTLFFYGMQAVTLAFVTWPDRLLVVYDGARHSCHLFRSWNQRLDPDGIQDWQPFPAAGSIPGDPSREKLAEGLHLIVREKTYAGFAAIRRLLLYSPVFWMLATTLLAVAPAGAAWWRRVLVAAVLVFFLPVFEPIGNWVYHRLTGVRPQAVPES